MASTPRLPPELTDRIIDFLHDDFAALPQCSLVCRQWLPASSLHLFRSLRVRTSCAARYSQVLVLHIDFGYDRGACLGFLAILRESRRMRSHITKLALNADIGRGGSELGIDLVVLQHILENLPYLRYLHICAPCIYSAVAHDQLTPLSVSPRLPALQKICLQNVSLLWPVLQFLRWFPRIRELQFRNLQDTADFSTHLQRWLTAGPYVLHLRSFVFDHPGDAYAALQSLHILHAVLHDDTLRALSITALPSYLFSALDSLLHDKGSNLRHLSIAYGQEGLGSPNPSFLPVKLACSSGLTSLRLLHHINLDCGPTPVGTFQWTGMLDMIAAGELFFLQSLVVVCKVHHYRDGQLHPCTHPPSRLEHMQRGLRWLDWEKFNAVLDRLAAHCLNNVEVQLWAFDSVLSPRLNTITRFSTHSGH